MEYENRTYGDVANTPMTAGEKLGPVTFTPCDDVGGRSGGQEEPIKTTAYTVDGLGTDVAIAVGDSVDEAELFAVRSGSGSGFRLPTEVEKFIDAS